MQETTTAPLGNSRNPAVLYFVFTFIGTLQPLALSSIEGGHFVRLAGRPADAGAVHGSDPEVVGAAHAQAVHRVFTNLHWGVIALDPSVAPGFTPNTSEKKIIKIYTMRLVYHLTTV